MIDQAIAEMLEKKDFEVPMLPEVAGKVVQLTQDPESDATALAKLIQGDQTLASHVMRVANSAAYSPNTNLVSLQQAISRLGMNLISDIALAASINSSLFNAPGFEKHIKAQLRHALASALWAKEVARACRRNVEAAFIAGLLHNIGKPAAVQAIVKMARKHKYPITKEEFVALETKFHSGFGLEIVQEWEMPEAVINAVRYFNDYSTTHDTMNQTMITVGGERFASHFSCEPSQGVCISLEELKAENVLAALDLYQDEIETLLEKNEQVTATLEAMSP